MKIIRWDPEKSDKLKRRRGIAFEEVVYHIERGDMIDITEHPNQAKYPRQQIYVLLIHDYIHLVPFTESDDEIFLKTIMPSRKAERAYHHE